jgi:Interleukin-like EMT inducer
MTVLDPGQESRPASRLRATWAVLATCTLLAGGLSWPLVAHLSDRVPGTATWAFDESTFLWNIWYFKHALLDLHTSPLHTNLIWFPLGTNLTLYTFNFFNALVALPLDLAANLPLASNLALLLSTILSGFGTYLLTFHVLRRAFAAKIHTPNLCILRLAAFLAGLVYAFGSNRAIYAALGHYNFVTCQWVPFYILYLLKTLHETRYRNAALAGLFFALAALVDMTYASFLSMFSLVILLASWRTLRARAATLLRIALAAVVAVAIWSPVLLPVARELAKAEYALSGWGETVQLSADLAGFVSPTDLNPLLAPPLASNANVAGQVTWGNDNFSPPGWQAALRAVVEGKGRFSDINTVFLGWVTLALALAGGWWASRRARLPDLAPWIWGTLVFAVLALGPLLQVAGRYRFNLDNLLPEGVSVPLPFALLHFIPILNANRAPNRNSLILMLTLAVLVAFGAVWLLGGVDAWQRREGGRGRNGGAAGQEPGSVALGIAPAPATRLSQFATRAWVPPTWAMPAVAAVVAVALLVEHLALPLPTTDARVPEVYTQIAAEPGDFSVLQLPLGWRNSFGVLGSERTQIQYYQSVHGKPIIGGNISRAPAFQMDYFGRISLFQALTRLEMYQDVSPALDAAVRSQAAALMALYDVRYFITFPPIAGGYPYQDTWQKTQDYALQVLPLEIPAFWEKDGIRAYHVQQAAIPFPFRLDLGAANLEPYLGQGWDVRPGEQIYGAEALWATATDDDLYLPLDAPKDATLRLAAAPLTFSSAPRQVLSITVNDVPVLRDEALAPGWQTLAVKIPASATRRGPNRVRLHFAWALSPRQVFPDPASRGAIGASGTISPVNLDVHSFDEAYISAFSADGRETKASPDRRGYNVVVLDPRSGRVLDAQGFDSAANTYEADRLAQYLSAVPRGRVVVLATKGDASAHLTPGAIAALRALGSRVASAGDLAGQAHALVGIQGAAPGSAAEVIAPGDAFLRVSGDFRKLAAAVDWVELGP